MDFFDAACDYNVNLATHGKVFLGEGVGISLFSILAPPDEYFCLKTLNERYVKFGFRFCLQRYLYEVRDVIIDNIINPDQATFVILSQPPIQSNAFNLKAHQIVFDDKKLIPLININTENTRTRYVVMGGRGM